MVVDMVLWTSKKPIIRKGLELTFRVSLLVGCLNRGDHGGGDVGYIYAVGRVISVTIEPLPGQQT